MIQAGDIAAAVALFAQAAAAGHAMSQYNYAKALCEGRGVSCSKKLAREWFEKAAENDHIGAMRDLGVMFHWGEGIDRDGVQAAHWYRRAATHPPWSDLLATSESAQTAACDSMNALGLLHLEGFGVPRDRALAVECFRKAADLGSTEARKNFASPEFALIRLRCPGFENAINVCLFLGTWWGSGFWNGIGALIAFRLVLFLIVESFALVAGV